MPEVRLPDGVRVAVDIGGTFTDIVLAGTDGTLHQGKVSTTSDDPARGVVEGLALLLGELDIAPAAVREVLHGTTVGSNTILQRAGSATGLITTQGFRDVLEIGRIRMPVMFDLTWSKPAPLVPRRHRLEVTERIAADGAIVTALDEAEVADAARQLVAAGIESVAICFINSYRNPVHEQRAAEIVRRVAPSLAVSASHAVLPEMKEYERTSTVVVNAYLLRTMQGYLARLERGLADIGVKAPLLVMTSNGGMLPAAVAAEKPVMVVASGPAGGAIGGARLGQARGTRDLVVFDMGGTTAKAVIVEGGEPSMTSEYEFRDGLSTSSRFITAGGYTLKVPAIDIAEVGAGGGSIAALDAGGLLTVGPQSAGADPGPACYGRGNDKPTVTDANVVLGILNPAALAGGQLPIEKARAVAAIEREIARPLGLDCLAAAHGIRAVAIATMARAIRSVTVERGRDPRDLELVAFGGNGGVHAAEIAALLGIGRVIVPPLAGVFSALGMLGADVEHTFVATQLVRLDRLKAEVLAGAMAGLETQARARLEADGYSRADTRLLWLAELRYEGQASELAVPLTPGLEMVPHMAADFARLYRDTYGYTDLSPVELVKLRLVGRGLLRNRLSFDRLVVAERAGATHAPTRLVSFARGEAPRETPLVKRADLGRMPRPGPLLIEEFDSTIVVPPGATASLDAQASVTIEIGAGVRPSGSDTMTRR